MNAKRLGLFLFSVVLFAFLQVSMAATFYVKNTADAGSDSFRDALAGASGAGPGAHTIVFKLPYHNRTIELTSAGLEYNNPDNADLTIIGQKDATVDGTDTYRILDSISTGNLAISKLHFQNGLANGGNGGALQVAGNLLVRLCSFAHNQADTFGGAISLVANDVELYIENSRFDWNTANGGGAVLAAGVDPTTTIIGSEFRDNNASQFSGGALHTAAPGAVLSVVDSLFERNTASGQGGAMTVGGGPVSIVRSTFLDNDNSAGFGGAIVTEVSFAAVEIRDSVFKRNRALGGPGGGGAFARSTNGSLSVYNSWFEENESLVDGGAIWIGPLDPAEIVGCTFIKNHTGSGGAGVGGAIHDVGGALTRVEGSFFQGNSAEADGGAIHAGFGNNTIERIFRDSSFEGNHAGRVGGAVFLGFDATLRTENVTITNNYAGVRGGGVGADLDAAEFGLTLVYSTVVDNEAPVGANLYSSTPLVSQNSVIALPRLGANCNIPSGTGNFNFVDDDGSCGIVGFGNRTGTDPKLASLRDNGGPVPTRKPRWGSPLIDAIDSFACYPYGVVEDARGVLRPKHKRCDIGAVEVKSCLSPLWCN